MLAATAAPPPNCVKFTVALLMVSLLLSPPAVLFQVAVTVSPILKAPPKPVAAAVHGAAAHSADFAEGRRAFGEKRPPPPRFEGR